jgi:hypothetical protein
MLALPHPYCRPDRLAAAVPHGSRDPLRVAQSVTNAFLVGWSLLRVVVGLFRGFDVEACAAFAIAVAAGRIRIGVTAPQAHAKRRARSSTSLASSSWSTQGKSRCHGSFSWE